MIHVLCHAADIDWNFAGQVSGYGFAGVFVAMSVLALVIWLVGKCHTAFAEKLKGKGSLIAAFILMILTILIMAHIISEKRKEIETHSSVKSGADVKAPVGEEN
ncbi:MAG: hypothetical protein ACYS8W_14760 [Planctomycetota bacterium]|jgi:predicted membrane protein